MTKWQSSRGLLSAADAVGAAEEAAQAPRLSIRDLCSLVELAAACRLFAKIWDATPGDPRMTSESLRGLAIGGNYLVGAFEGDELVGASVGFFEAPSAESIHSQLAGVLPRVRGRNVGWALKLHQRAWTLQCAVSTIAWTFDPLISRNAYFNRDKLGATPIEYSNP